MVRNSIAFLQICFSLVVFYGCGNANSEVMKLVEERDSLRQQNKEQVERIENYGKTIETLNETLDSIAYQESIIFSGNGEVPITKEDVKYNLMRFEVLLKKQSEKISQLEKQLAESNDKNEQSLGLIAHLKEQLEAKNRQIIQLKEELEKKNVDIAQLKERVESQELTINTQTATINELSQRTQRQDEALARQDAILNNGYVLIGTKNDLKQKGIIRKGKLVSDATMDRTKFMKVDIRECRELTFSAKRPRILTNMPASSYEITTAGDRIFTLNVKDPADFWRISTYLIIQTD